jgi:GH24 family phage-related lysozyme (muramidase)
MIDFGFISDLEGRSLVGYVPDVNNSKSGVTIACGFDLGQRSINELDDAFGCGLADNLSIYAGLTGSDAVEALEITPLLITEKECEIINKYAHKQAVSRLLAEWNKESFTPFSMLPNEAQTVVASVAFQYGSLEKRTPNFWRQVTAGDWAGAIKNLRDFGDRYPTRRNKEADLLESRLNEAAI